MVTESIDESLFFQIISSDDYFDVFGGAGFAFCPSQALFPPLCDCVSVLGLLIVQHVVSDRSYLVILRGARSAKVVV